MRVGFVVLVCWLCGASWGWADKLACKSTKYPQLSMTSWSRSGGARPYPGKLVGEETWKVGKKVIGMIKRYAYGRSKHRYGPRKMKPTIKVTWLHKTRKVLWPRPTGKSQGYQAISRQTYRIKARLESLVRKRLHKKLPKGAVTLTLRCKAVYYRGMP